jgi:hypothetical protein
VLAGFLLPNQPPPMPEVRDDIPHALSPLRTAAKAVHLASEANALQADCVTAPLSEHLPGLLRTGIPYPSSGVLRSLVQSPVIRNLLRTASRAKRAEHELMANMPLISWLD